MARGVIAYPVNIAFRFFFKALMASLVFVVLSQRAVAAKQLALAGTMSQQVESMLVAVILPWVFVVLFWKSDAIAAGLLQGLPGLSVGHFLQAGGGPVATRI